MKRSDIEYVLEALGGDGSYKVSGQHLMTGCVYAPCSQPGAVSE